MKPASDFGLRSENNGSRMKDELNSPKFHTLHVLFVLPGIPSPSLLELEPCLLQSPRALAL